MFYISQGVRSFHNLKRIHSLKLFFNKRLHPRKGIGCILGHKLEKSCQQPRFLVSHLRTHLFPLSSIHTPSWNSEKNWGKIMINRELK